jgi:hypothetical protein
MKRKGWLVFAAVMAVVVGFMGCITEDEENRKHGRVPLTWEDVAQIIDNQMKQIADGTKSTCGGNDTLDWGVHCANQLTGSVSQGSVLQLVRINNDLPGFFGDLTSSGDSDFIIKHGFQAQTSSPCTEDLLGGVLPQIGNDTADVYEVCINGDGLTHIKSCTPHGDSSYTVVYDRCQWSDGVTTWVLSGQVTHSFFSTTEDEIIHVATLDGFTLTKNISLPHPTVRLFGNVARYQVINPITGIAAFGTTPVVPSLHDGMDIFNLRVTVDLDGDSVADVTAPYTLTFARDFEDGLILLNGTAGVWVRNPNVTTKLDFYTASRRYNGHDFTGCFLDIDPPLPPPAAPPAPAGRVFNIINHATYGVNACLPDSTAPIAY